jgi:hypothetical protein
VNGRRWGGYKTAGFSMGQSSARGRANAVRGRGRSSTGALTAEEARDLLLVKGPCEAATFKERNRPRARRKPNAAPAPARAQRRCHSSESHWMVHNSGTSCRNQPTRDYQSVNSGLASGDLNRRRRSARRSPRRRAGSRARPRQPPARARPAPRRARLNTVTQQHSSTAAQQHSSTAVSQCNAKGAGRRGRTGRTCILWGLSKWRFHQ